MKVGKKIFGRWMRRSRPGRRPLLDRWGVERGGWCQLPRWWNSTERGSCGGVREEGRGVAGEEVGREQRRHLHRGG